MGNEQIMKHEQINDKQIKQNNRNDLNNRQQIAFQQMSIDLQTQQNECQSIQDPFLLFKKNHIKQSELEKLLIKLGTTGSLYKEVQKKQIKKQQQDQKEQVLIISSSHKKQKSPDNNKLQSDIYIQIQEHRKKLEEQKEQHIQHQNQNQQSFQMEFNHLTQQSEFNKNNQYQAQLEYSNYNEQENMNQKPIFLTNQKENEVLDQSKQQNENYNFINTSKLTKQKQELIQELKMRQKETINKFSQFKGVTIQVQDDNTVATQKGVYYMNQKIILTQPITTKNSECSFRIDQIKYCVGFGIAFKQTIQRHDYNYKSQGNELGHGLYIITTQGYSWSHAQKEEDDIFRPQFKTLYPGAVVTVSLQGQTLKFKWKKGQFICSVRSQLTKKYTLTFCAYLHEKGDGVSIVQK